MAQSQEKVEAYYSEFLDYEFEDRKKAKKALDAGLEAARKIQDMSLIAFGHKYLSWYYDDSFEHSKSLTHIDSTIYYFKQINDKVELGNALNLKGNVLSDIALLDSSLIFYQLALDIANETNDLESRNKVLNNIALVHTDQGEYLKAMNYFHESINICKELNDQESLGDAYNNIGSLFSQFEDYERAMEYHKLALAIRLQSDDIVRLSSVYANIGRIHLAKKEYDLALEFTKKSLAIDLELNDLAGIALNYNNMALSYFYSSKLDSAKKYFDLSLSLRKELNDPFGMVMSYNNLGEYYNLKENYAEAIDNCRKAYQLTIENNLLYERTSSCNCLSVAYAKTSKHLLAYKYLKEFVELQNFLVSEKNQKELIKNEMQYVFHYQNLEDSLKRAEIQAKKDIETSIKIKTSELEKEQAISAKRNQLLLFSMLGFFLVTIAIILLYSIKKQKRKTELIRQKNEFIKHQKDEIDQSIEYARLIQHTALPSIELKQLFSSSFLVFLPRDIVSGDFYWLEENDDHSFFSVADCTGHGIPGAFISMIGTILLNEIYNSKQLKAPNEMLDELNRLVQLTLFGRSGIQMKDGMDIAFCRWDKQTKTLHFSGANNPLWVISKAGSIAHEINGEKTNNILPNIEQKGINLFEIKADKQPVGKYNDDPKNFSLHSLKLLEGDMIYLFTDGYADQFGGEFGKKFKYKPFKQLLLSISQNDSDSQEVELINHLKQWQGHHEQIDDICIMGVRV